MPEFPAELLDNKLNYQLHENAVIIEQYPSKYIKEAFQTQQQAINNTKIIETFNRRFHLVDGIFANARWKLNILKTKQLASSKHMMSNYIDATPMFQHKFKTRNITDNLTFLNERVQRNQELDGTCPLCKTSIDEKPIYGHARTQLISCPT